MRRPPASGSFPSGRRRSPRRREAEGLFLADEPCKAPPGKFRVVGWDRYDYTRYPIADYATRRGALARAGKEARAARKRASPPSSADVIQVYDDEGRLVRAFGA